MGGGVGRVLSVAANTFRETVRERVLYNLVLFAILMTLSGLLLKQLSIRQDEKIVKDVGLAAMEVFGGLIAIFVGVSLVSKEIDRRSLYPLLAKPVSRGEFYVGKFSGLAFTLLINVSVMAAGLLATLMATGRGVDLSLFKAIAPIYLGLLLIVAIALFLSTVTSSVLATFGTVCLVVAGRYADVIGNMKEIVPGAPGWLTRAVYLLLPNFSNLDFKTRVAYGDPVPWSDIGLVSVYAALYIALLLTAGAMAFRARELQ